MSHSDAPPPYTPQVAATGGPNQPYPPGAQYSSYPPNYPGNNQPNYPGNSQPSYPGNNQPNYPPYAGVHVQQQQPARGQIYYPAVPNSHPNQRGYKQQRPTQTTVVLMRNDDVEQQERLRRQQEAEADAAAGACCCITCLNAMLCCLICD